MRADGLRIASYATGMPATPQSGGWSPLSGTKVVDFAMFVPGPFCSSILADLGAEVVKVESVAGLVKSGAVTVG